MCGIAGIYNKTEKNVNPQDLLLMNGMLSHRGPDASGTWADKNIGLSHTRLSIIDLSSLGKQPMTNEDGKIWITYNGEIYNFEYLRQWLIDLGHQFKSTTDTEVIIHLYEEVGIECLAHLRGMFAFSIWDSNKKQLFIARDRIGKKPLYYTNQQGCFVFASELKALKSLPWLNFDVEYDNFADVFAYDHVPWPKTMFKDVFKLPPSSYMIVNGEGVHDVRTYWKLDLQHKHEISLDQASDELKQLLKESVSLRLRSDVPLGMFLSGGLDSSYIVGLASQLVNEPISTFSIGYKDDNTSDPEYHFSREVAEHFQTKHTELLFDKGLIVYMPQLMKNYDEPFCIPNALAHYQLCRETRKSVVVALSGDGSDEIFGGYDVYHRLRFVEALSFLSPLRNSIKSKKYTGNFSNKYLLAMCLAMIPRAHRRGYLKQVNFRSRSKKIFSDTFNISIDNYCLSGLLDQFYIDQNPKCFMDGVLAQDLFINYAWATTIATDISGMSNSLEVRSPFLDHKLVEFAFSLPVSLKIGDKKQEKKVLYEAAKGFLPENITNRKKMSYGVGIPYQRLFYNDWHEYVKEIILDDSVKNMNLFNLDTIEKMISQKNASYDDFRTLWKVFCTCCWVHGLY
ncbi:asparagine synthetase B [Desulfosarcina alkanivorans]|uniref:asparagine synthase (glutamine-hydrolyzing) n=1 Tax=Desulfosarcina alkanivorans TaxID=571177 RepID=A0A5K7YFM3_9BACT|nr:asparagine synthase (glutamine-hydrolyzing) [Desulfosarcina alkanivorans]BBO67275.1 asparagine synthetase B [Desulfosarcina alkanivorans]